MALFTLEFVMPVKTRRASLSAANVVEGSKSKKSSTQERQGPAATPIHSAPSRRISVTELQAFVKSRMV